MGALEEAIEEIDAARNASEQTEISTKLDSIAVSLGEMADAEGGTLTADEDAFADTEFAGSAPSEENLAEVEGELAELAGRLGGDARAHLEAARDKVSSHRTARRESDHGHE